MKIVNNFALTAVSIAFTPHGMDPYLITTLVGLICNFRAERGAREALAHQQFIEWLEYHRHEDLKNLIVNQAALQTEVDNLLRQDMNTMMHKLDDISGILVSILVRLDDFKGFVAAARPPESQLSEQALSILIHFARVGHGPLYYNDYGGGNQVFTIMHAPVDIPVMRVTEERFLQDDLKALIGYGFLDVVDTNDQGGWLCKLTRSGQKFADMVGDSVHPSSIPASSIPE